MRTGIKQRMRVWCCSMHFRWSYSGEILNHILGSSGAAVTKPLIRYDISSGISMALAEAVAEGVKGRRLDFPRSKPDSRACERVEP